MSVGFCNPNYKPDQVYKTNKKLTLYAVWSANEVKITWNTNGGSTVVSSVLTQ